LVAELLEALKPFARIKLMPHWSDQSILARGDYEALKVADFRRVHEAIARAEAALADR